MISLKLWLSLAIWGFYWLNNSHFMSTLKSYVFSQVEWKVAAKDIMKIREKVFIIEQRFDENYLVDAHDADSFHLLVTNSKGKAVACGRLSYMGKIGRIAVKINHRGNGLGTMLLNKLIKIAEEHQIKNVCLNTETELSGFYNQQKFHSDGPVYMKQGVPFQRMSKRLA